MFKALAIVYREGLAEGSCYSPFLRFLAALRIMFFPNTITQFHSMELMFKLYNPARKHDPLYFLVHNYYMSKKFTLRQRVQSAMSHHGYELDNYNSDYARQVYRSNGILLWERSIDTLHFNIILIASEDNRHEGDLSVILSVNSVILCRMSFCYLSADILGLSSYMTMLVSRNQTYPTPFRESFDRCFKQNSPQLFCLSAICGIAMTNEFKTMFAIKHDAQIAYEETLDAGFRNSYTALWEKFDAVEIDRHVYMLNVPLKLRPIRLVNRVHRARARARRGYWDEIVGSARSGMLKYRTAPSPEQTPEVAPRGGPLSAAVGLEPTR
jgi:uncharacterized protein VirK/YbjX